MINSFVVEYIKIFDDQFLIETISAFFSVSFPLARRRHHYRCR